MAFKFVEDLIYSGTTLSSSVNTDYVDATFIDKISAQVSITTGGAVTWTAAVQGSNDGVTWVDTDTPTSVTGTVNLLFSIADATARYYRVALVRTGGTISTASVRFFGKG